MTKCTVKWKDVQLSDAKKQGLLGFDIIVLYIGQFHILTG